ncbi:MAG: ATP-binding protein [Acidobacteriota bacterium]
MLDLSTITSASAVWKPQRTLIYGVQGLGKTSLGCTFEAPILLRTEDGAMAIDVPTFPDIFKTYDQLCAAFAALHEQPHEYKTLVIDSLDWMEPLVWDHTCALIRQDTGKDITSIEQVGYGKGYVEADGPWRNIMGWLDALRLGRGMGIVLIAHAEVKRHEPPDGDPYDRFQIKLHKRAWALWQEWTDMVLFANYRRQMKKTKDGGAKGEDKFRAIGSGERVLYTDERPAYMAKNRWSLPHEIYIGQDKNWTAFHQALHAATSGRYALPQALAQNATTTPDAA